MASEPSTHELASLVSFCSGGTPSRAEAGLWGGDIPWISGKDMKSFRLFGSIETVTRGAVGNGTRCVPAGTILVLVRGMALFKSVPVGVAMQPLTFNQDVKALIPNKEANPTFLAYAVDARAPLLRASVTSAGHGTGRLITEALENLPIWLPPMPEQLRITTVLGAWDNAIATAEQLVAMKERRFAWMRAEVLTGRTRLLAFRGEWRRTSLAKVLTEHGGKSSGVEEVFSVSVHVGLINQIEHLGRSFAAATTDHYNCVNPGDIVYTKSPTGDFPLGVIKQSKLDHAVIVSPLYGVFTPRSRELGVFLDALFSSPNEAKRYLSPLVQKGAKNTIAVTNQQFLQGELLLPTDDEEVATLCLCVEAARDEIATAKKALRLLRLQKRGLMQKLLTGEWRAPEGIDRLMPDGAAETALAEAAAQ